MSKKIELGLEARKKLATGINKLADAVTSTLGPNGRNAIYMDNGEVRSTKDGVSVAKQISNVEDPIEDLGIQMIKQAAIKTANNAGDGTTTSTLLAQAIVNRGLANLDKGVNAVEMKRGIDEAVKEVVAELYKSISQDISSEDQIKQMFSGLNIVDFNIESEIQYHEYKPQADKLQQSYKLFSEYVKKTGEKYDLIVRSRFDLILEQKLDYNYIYDVCVSNPKFLFQSHINGINFGRDLNDQFAVSTPDVMEMYFKRFNEFIYTSQLLAYCHSSTIVIFGVSCDFI